MVLETLIVEALMNVKRTMKRWKMEKRRNEVEQAEGKIAAYVIAGILLAATFWASPSMGMLFLAALIICAAVCGAILLIASGIGAAEKAMANMAAKPRPEYRPAGARLSRTANA